MGIEDYKVEQLPNAENYIQLDSFDKANVDTQVSTAKRYPRNISRAVDNSIALATLDNETAQSMGYALPRGGKPITGPSVHLAKLVVSNWGNMRTEAKVVSVTDKEVISRGTAWDLENNVASAFEVRRKITGKDGRREYYEKIQDEHAWEETMAYLNRVR